MNPLAANYVAKDSFLHRLSPASKLLLLILYAVALFNCTAPWQVVAFMAVITATILLLTLPFNLRISFCTVAILLLAIWYFEPASKLMQQLVLAIGKITTLNLMIALFNMTTRPRDLIALLASVKNVRQHFGSVLFTVSTMITVAPTIERDVQRAIDTETLRRGSAPRFFSLNAWAAILIILLSRVLKRAEALTTSILDRGYSPSSSVTFINHRNTRWQDVAVMLALSIPAIVILFAL